MPLPNLEIRHHQDPRDIIRAVEALTQNKVLVGVPSTRAGRTDTPITNAAIAYVHEHGSPRQRIPPRPFLEPGVRDAEEEIVERLKDAADYAMDGNKQATIRALHGVGMTAQNAVRAKITNGPFTPLSLLTIAARLRRGNKSTKPLIDTGALRQAISYVLRGKWF